MKDILNLISLPTDKAERKEFIKALFGGIAVMTLCYITIWAVYIFAPAGYWNGF